MNSFFKGLGLGLALAIALAAPAAAATLKSISSNNIGTAATWGTVDSASYLNSESASTGITSTPVASSTFTPAASTVSEIGIRLAFRNSSPSGTFTAKLANATSPGTRECTQTVNVADLVAADTTAVQGGWAFFTCSASPNGTDTYTVTLSTSAASGQVSAYSSATTNWARALVTTTTAAAAAGDKLIVAGNRTGAGTGNAFTVTINTTVLVNYGNVANTLVDPSVSVNQGGTLAFASSASTAYVSEFAGPAVIYSGGALTIGTSGTPIPSTSTAVLTLNSTAEGDTGIVVRNGGSMSAFGVSQGRNVVKTRLTATATGGSTTALTTEDATGWLSGDVVAVAGTASTQVLQDEIKTLGVNASGTTVTIPSAFTNTHTAQRLNYTSSNTGKTYDFKMYPDLVLLTRNVKITGNSSQNGYIYFAASSVFSGDWVEFANIGGTYATTGKRGLEVDTGPLGAFSLTNFSLHDSRNSALIIGAGNANFGGTLGNYMTFQNGAIYNVANINNGTQYGVGINPALTSQSSNPYWKFDNIVVIHSGGQNFAQIGMSIASLAGQVTNLTVANSSAGGSPALRLGSNYNFAQSSFGAAINSWGPITTYSNIGTQTIEMSSALVYGASGTINGVYQWNEGGRLYGPITSGDIVLDPFYQVQTQYGIYLPSAGGGKLTVRNGVQAWTSLSNSFPLTNDAKQTEIYYDNMELCPNGSSGTFGIAVVGCSLATNRQLIISLVHDVGPTGGNSAPPNSRIYLRNTSILNGLTTNWPNQAGEEAWYGPTTFIAHDCAACTVNGNAIKHGMWVAGGYLFYDTAISHGSGYSTRMTPLIPTFSGYITANADGTGTLNVTTAQQTNITLGDRLSSNDAGLIPGTKITAGSSTPFTVNLAQTVCSSGSPCQFQTYYNGTGLLPKMTSAPVGFGQKVAVASGQTANVCVWLRPSISTDSAPLWGGSAVTYNGSNPRMLVRQNPYMGVQSDTVLATSSPTAGAWSQLCADTPVAPADGQFELVVDADQTFTSNVGGSVNVAEWSCTSCSSLSDRFWANGVAGGSIGPAGAGGGGGGGASFGGRGGFSP